MNLGVFPSGKSYPTPADDRFWAAAVDMRMPLTVHVGFDRLGPRAAQPTFEYPDADPEVLKKLGPRKIVEWVALPFLGIPPALSLAQLILSGIFEETLRNVVALALFPTLHVPGLALSYAVAYLLAAAVAMTVLTRRVGSLGDAGLRCSGGEKRGERTGGSQDLLHRVPPVWATAPGNPENSLGGLDPDVGQ